MDFFSVWLMCAVVTMLIDFVMEVSGFNEPIKNELRDMRIEPATPADRVLLNVLIWPLILICFICEFWERWDESRG